MGESGKSVQNASPVLMGMISDFTDVAKGKPVVTKMWPVIHCLEGQIGQKPVYIRTWIGVSTNTLSGDKSGIAIIEINT